jgi:hypothetical protein
MQHTVHVSFTPAFWLAATSVSLTCFALTARLIACSSHVVDANPLILPICRSLGLEAPLRKVSGNRMTVMA